MDRWDHLCVLIEQMLNKFINKYKLRKPLKLLAVVFSSLLLFLVLLIVAIRIPAVQRVIVNKVKTTLQQKLQTELSIGHLYLTFPKKIEVQDFYLEDRSNDTLLYLSELSVDISLYALLERNISVSSIYIEGITGNVAKIGDGKFNFSFIEEAFAADTVPKKTRINPWNFDIENIMIKRLKFDYQDKILDSHISAYWTDLTLDVKKIDFEASVYMLESLELTGANIEYKDTGEVPVAVSDTDTKVTDMPNVEVDKLTIENTKFSFDLPQVRTNGDIGSLLLKTKSFDLNSLSAEVSLFELSNSHIQVSLPDDTLVARETSAQNKGVSSMPDIRIDQFKLLNNSVQYDLGTLKARSSKYFDPKHIHLNKISSKLDQVVVGADLSYSAEIKAFSFITSGQFELRELSGDVQFSDQKILVKDLEISTPYSQLSTRLESSYPAIDEIMGPETTISLDIKASTIAYEDVNYFYPELGEVVKPITSSLSLKASVEGSFNNLDINDLKLSLLNNTSLSASGNIKHFLTDSLPAIDSIVITLSSARKDIKRMLPDSLIPKNIALPERFKIVARVDQKLDSIVANIKLNSEYGALEIKSGLLYHDSIPHYEMNLSSKAFDVGKLLKQKKKDLDSLKVAVDMQGHGTTLKNGKLNLSALVENLRYQNYIYDSLRLTAGLTEEIITLDLGILDEHIKVTMDGSADLSDPNSHYKLKMKVDKAALGRLRLVRDPLIVKGVVSADIKTKDFRKIDGEIAIKSFSANNGIDTYEFDSLVYASFDQDGQTNLSLRSDMLEGNFKGNVDAASLVTVFSRHLDQYYDFMPDTSVVEEDVRFTFDFNVKDTDLLTEIILPELSDFRPGIWKGAFDSRTDDLMMQFDITHLTYGEIMIDDLVFTVDSDPKTLQSSLYIDKISNKKMKIFGLAFGFSVADNQMVSNLSIQDSLSEVKYRITTLINSLAEGYMISMNPDSLLLDYKQWSIPPDNNIVLKNNQIETNEFVLSRDGHEISFSKNSISDSLLKVNFKEVKLSTISSAIESNKQIFDGLLNGDVSITMPPAQLKILADIKVENFKYLDYLWGDVGIKVDGIQNEKYNLNGWIKGGENVANFSGNYISPETGQESENIDLALELKKFELETLSPILVEVVKDLSGIVKGTATVTGSMKNLDIDGKLSLTNTKFNPLMLNNGLSIKEETIIIKNSKVSLNKFVLKDVKRNSATLNGSVTLVQPSYYKFDMKIETRDFLVLNTFKGDNDLFYGQLRTDGVASISGSSSRPKVDLNLEISPESNVTYVIPETKYTALNHDHVVRFINDKRQEPQQVELNQRLDSLSFKGIQLDANLSIKDKSALTIVIDPVTSDKLVVKGNAALSLQIDLKGDIVLNGRYSLTEGYYDFSFYKLVKRKFDVKRGSSIAWKGDPFEAVLDITASHHVEAPAYDLIANQLSSASAGDLERYKQRLPFIVNINVDGGLSQPEISFEIDMPERERGSFGGNVYARIQDLNTRESDLNKQVFALLILKRFMSDTPLQSESGYNLEGNARRSASRILSDQLNRLTDNIKAVDLNVNLESSQDYSSGEVKNNTQLELGLSKTLLNDRLQVSVAGNVSLEGQEQQQFSDYVGDLILEYSITPDGRFRVTGFRRSDYDIISGDVIESGAGIIYVKDYNTLKELFQSNDEN